MPKKCLKCKVEKNLADFSKSPAKDGIYYCKSCMGYQSPKKGKGPSQKKKKKRKKSKKGKTRQVAPDWLKKYSKEERKELRRRRKKRLQEATPPWADKEQIRHIYEVARLKGMHVDHKIPLMHSKVCGLHCEDNLQLMNPEENIKKGNTFKV